MFRLPISASLRAVAIVVCLAGCAPLRPPKPKPPVPEPARKLSHWEGDGVTGAPSILINLAEQRAHFFKGKKEVGQAVISSGKKGFETPTGDFKVIQQDKNHVSNLYGDFVDETGAVVKSNVDITKEKPPEGASFRGAKMPFFLRFHDGAGMHAGRLPGYAASHGCVRLPRFMAEHFFANAPLGTPVAVTGDTPSGGTAKSPAKKTHPQPPETPAKPTEPTEATPPTPAPESVKPADGEPEKKPAPADPAPVPPNP